MALLSSELFDIWNISFVFFAHGEDELCPESESAADLHFSSVGGSCTSFRNFMFWARSRLCVIVDGIVSLCWQIQRLSNADN